MSQVNSYKQGMAKWRVVHDDERGDLCTYEDNDGCPQVIALPHSCDEWRIGGAEAVETLINDLKELLRGRD